MSNYGLEINGLKNSQMPCLYLSHIIDVRLVSGKDLTYGEMTSKNLDIFSPDKSGDMSMTEISCVKFIGDTYQDSYSGIANGAAYSRGNGAGVYFRPSKFWDFKIYCYKPLHPNLNGYGLVTYNTDGVPTFFATANIAYAEDFKIGEVKGEQRLYISSPYALHGDMMSFYATNKHGQLVRASCYNGNSERENYDLDIPIFSITPPTKEEEDILKNNGKIVYIR